MFKIEEMTRRGFLVGGAKVAVGAAVGTGAMSLLSGCQAPTPTATPVPPTATPQVAQWPWPYVQLDPQLVAQKAYAGFYQGACAYGAFNAIVSSLAEKVGYPYIVIPTQMAQYGEGGVVGWATVCGGLNGASMAINLVAKDFKDLVDELVGWYTQYAFPIFKPAKAKTEIAAVTSVSNSPLCHSSVTKWVKAAGVKSESPQRSERCARLTADVAMHAVELLNSYSAGQFKKTFVVSSSVKECGACHLKGGTIENARGKTSCIQCHTPQSLPAQHPK